MSKLVKKNQSVLGYDTLYYEVGQGQNLLLLSGAGGPEPMFEMAEVLSASYRVILPEHPGFGMGDMPSWLERVPDLAQFYRLFMAALDLEDVHLVGHSLGGWAAAEIAVRDTSRLATLTLISAAGIKVKNIPIADNFLWDRERTLRNFFADPAFAEKILVSPIDDDMILLSLKRQETVARLVWNPRWYNPDLQKWLRMIDVPALVLWGDEDRLFSPAHAKVYGAEISGSSCIIIKECGHIPFIEKQQECLQHIQSFLEES